MGSFLAYLAAGLTGAWGIAHALPTRQVAAGFEPITADNRRVLVQEWIIEAVAMWAIALIVIVATVVGGGAETTRATDRVAAGALLVIAAVTASTGARTPVVWFKVCVGLLTVAAGLLIGASFA